MITIIITMIFLTIMSFMNPDQLLKSGEEYLDYLEGGWSGQNLLLVVCWRKPSLKPETGVEEGFKYMQPNLKGSKEKAAFSTLGKPLPGTPRLLSFWPLCSPGWSRFTIASFYLAPFCVFGNGIIITLMLTAIGGMPLLASISLVLSWVTPMWLQT